MTTADPNAVAHWLKEATSATRVEFDQAFNTDAWLFRGNRPGQPSVELEIAGNAMDDYTTDQILADLDASAVPARLVKDPSLRLQYHADRSIPHFETKHIRCDDRAYRIVRDSKHHVLVFDVVDKVLQNMPKDVLGLSESIFRRHDQQWREDVRRWRDGDQ